MRRRLDKNVKMYTGDDFNYAELIAGDEQGFFARAARHLRCHRAGGVLRAVAARGRRRGRLPRRAGADGAAVAPYLQGADALLQDRHRVHGLAQRPSGSFHHGRRAGEHALDAASGRTVSPRRQGRPARQSGTGDAADEDGAGNARHRAPDAGFFFRSSLAVAEHGDRPQAGRSHRRSSRPARGTASAPSIPGATRSRRSASTAPCARCATPGSNLSGYCRGGMFTADAAHRIEARDDNRRAVDEAKALGAPCIVLVVGGLPQYSRPGSAASKDIAAARTQVHDAIAEMLEYARAGEHAARDRAAASGLCRRPRLREHDETGARYLRRARSAAHRARSASRSTSITSGGIRN